MYVICKLESKDEQNIKRRVYDALNVMIASKVLRKDGKKVKSDIYSEM
jgi:transcription factor Dp-1